jgi:O-succinylbenzoic acid--CoA ligase
VGGAASDALPNNAIATYGMTETAGGVVYDGAPLDDVDVRLEHGEILVRTPSMARTYRHAPLPLQDGWLATGDLGDLDGQQLVVKGRRDDLIITGGVKVWPRVVEARLREHALVNDVCVIGAPDAQWGSIVVAYISTSATAVPTLEQLRSHVKETLSPPHAPQRLVVVPKIPRTTLGKVRRSELPSV